MKKNVLLITIIALLVLNMNCFAAADNTAEEILSGENVEICEEEAPLETIEPIETSEPAETAEPTEPAETAEPFETVEPTETTEPTETVEPVETIEPVETVEPIETAKPTETTEPIETAEPAETAEPTETIEPTETVEPTEKAKSTETAELTKNTAQSETKNSAETAEPSNLPQSDLVTITVEEIASSGAYLHFLKKGDKIDISEFSKTCCIQAADKQYFECDIDWKDADNTDTAAAGRIAVTGRIVPPEGYKFDKEYTVEEAVLVYDPDGEPTEAVYPDAENIELTQLIPIGSNPGEYINYDNEYLFFTEHGDPFYCKAEWDKCGDAENSGELSVFGRYILPSGVYMKDENIAELKFYAMADDEISLEHVMVYNGEISCYWLKEIDNIDDIKVYYAVEEGEWDMTDEYGFVLDNGFFIPTSQLKADTNYYFKLYYENKFTDVLHVILSGDDIKTDNITGDRDGGDNSSQIIPPLVQPDKSTKNDKNTDADKTSSSNMQKSAHSSSGTKSLLIMPIAQSPQSQRQEAAEQILSQNDDKNIITKPSIEAVTRAENISGSSPAQDNYETVTPNETSVTGKHLEEMQNIGGGSASFEKDGIMLELADDFMDKNDISPTDMVKIYIERAADKIKLDVAVNDNNTADLSGAKMRVPSDMELSLDGNLLENVSNSGGTAVFPIDAVGEYNIDKQENKVKFPLKEIITVGLAAVLGAAYFISRKVHKHKS